MGELNRDYVTAARLAGASLPRLMFITVLPNCMAPLIVQATLSFSSAILDAAALGFLGLGVQPPTPEWGTMLASARDYIERAWWVVSLPGLAILLSVLAINLMGDGLRDALDPKLKKRRLRRFPCHCRNQESQRPFWRRQGRAGGRWFEPVCG
jgi:dipeptide transport system permease protein